MSQLSLYGWIEKITYSCKFLSYADHKKVIAHLIAFAESHSKVLNHLNVDPLSPNHYFKRDFIEIVYNREQVVFDLYLVNETYTSDFIGCTMQIVQSYNVQCTLNLIKTLSKEIKNCSLSVARASVLCTLTRPWTIGRYARTKIETKESNDEKVRHL